jgi:hypothetical protein
MNAKVLYCLGIPLIGYVLRATGRISTAHGTALVLAFCHCPRLVYLANTIIVYHLARMLENEDNVDAVNYREGAMFERNTPPHWLNSINAYSLDFDGRVTDPSSKNFKVDFRGVPGGSVLSFGKVTTSEEALAPATGVYTLDFRFPMSPIQAFALAVVACERKLTVN